MHEDRTKRVQIIIICSILHRTSFIQNLLTLTIREFQFVVRHKAAGFAREALIPSSMSTNHTY